jgi:hypothetical protein
MLDNDFGITVTEEMAETGVRAAEAKVNMLLTAIANPRKIAPTATEEELVEGVKVLQAELIKARADLIEMTGILDEMRAEFTHDDHCVCKECCAKRPSDLNSLFGALFGAVTDMMEGIDQHLNEDTDKPVSPSPESNNQ